MKYLLTSLFSLSLFIGNSFAQKTIMDEFAQVREVASFDAVNVSGAFEVILTQGNQQVVVVSATDENLRNLIETDVKGGTLYIGLKKSNVDWRGGRKFRAYISATSLRKIDIGGYSNFTIDNGLTFEDLEITISGSSDFKGKIEGRNLKLTSSGSSDFDLTGKADKLSMVTSGSSDMKAYGMVVDYCDITGSGNSLIEITMNKEMIVNVSGGSKVYYKGSGTVKEFNASGKSSLHKQD